MRMRLEDGSEALSRSILVGAGVGPWGGKQSAQAAIPDTSAPVPPDKALRTGQSHPGGQIPSPSHSHGWCAEKPARQESSFVPSACKGAIHVSLECALGVACGKMLFPVLDAGCCWQSPSSPRRIRSCQRFYRGYGVLRTVIFAEYM